MLVEGQDFSGRNNANQRTPADGGSPRQQMYVFDGPINGELTVAPPVGAIAFTTASFGAQTFDVTAPVVASAPLNGCTAFTNAAAVAGNIAIIDRGVCGFAVKAAFAQAAGAVGVIIANNVAGPAIGLGGADPAVTIGTLGISQADGGVIRAALPTTARLRRAPSIDVDGTLDTQIIAHEWFHSTSNRLVGNASGLSNQQGRGMGEGWSDFAGLILSVRPEDRNVTGNDRYQGAYPVAVYSTLDSYYGIRRAPYSTNLNVFPFTFRHISDGVALPNNAPILIFGANSQVHNTGTIWANTLWEFYVNLLNDPRYTFTQARERMKDYVIAGLKMTPNAPTLLEARDGVLAAALATNEADFGLAATAFAKRGMGAGAIAPNRNSATNQGPNAVEDFTVFAGNLAVTEASLDFTYFDGALGFIDNDGVLDPGETALLTVSMVNNGTAAITSDVTASISSNGGLVFQTTAGRTGTPVVPRASVGTITFPATAAAPIAIGSSVTGTIEVALGSATTTAQSVIVSVAFPQVGATPTAVFEPGTQQIAIDVNYDIRAATRTADNLEQPQASVIDWGRTLIGGGSNWQVVNGNVAPYLFATGNIWSVPNNSAASDVRLTTPALTVAAASGLTMSFQHYFQFEGAGLLPDGTVAGFDGGVIEISSDAGATWRDVVAAGGTFTVGGGYNGVILALEADGTFAPFGAETPAAGFVFDNFDAAGGLLESVTLSLPNSFAGQTVRLRFRMATDTSVGDFGWSIDNVSFTGITNTPFSSVAAENGVADNAAPVAAAGADRTVSANRVTTLNGTASTDDVGIVSYLWTQTAGPTVTLTGATTPSATFTATVNGTYTFSLRVTDVRQATGTDSITLTVVSPPVSNAGPDQSVRPFSDVVLDGRGSTAPSGGTLSYAWLQTSGPAVTLVNGSTSVARFAAGETGVYVFRLRVTDSRTGATTDDSVSINVTIPAGGSFGYLMLLPGLVAVWLRRRRRIGT